MKGKQEFLEEEGIADLGAGHRMWHFPFITSSTLVDLLVAEGLQQYSYGDPKLEFSVPLHFFDELDTFYNFRWQDLLGMSTTGAGESGRYYYIESLTYDFMGDKINVVAIDLQYILRRYFVLGDETTLASNWSAAGEDDRMFGYLCDETANLFADGEPGKALVDEGFLEDY